MWVLLLFVFLGLVLDYFIVYSLLHLGMFDTICLIILYFLYHWFIFWVTFSYVGRYIRQSLLDLLNSCYYVGDERRTYLNIVRVIKELLVNKK